MDKPEQDAVQEAYLAWLRGMYDVLLDGLIRGDDKPATERLQKGIWLARKARDLMLAELVNVAFGGLTPRDVTECRHLSRTEERCGLPSGHDGPHSWMK